MAPPSSLRAHVKLGTELPLAATVKLTLAPGFTDTDVVRMMMAGAEVSLPPLPPDPPQARFTAKAAGTIRYHRMKNHG